MARDKALMAERDANVRDMYENLRSKKNARGKRLYSAAKVLYEISRKWKISERTVERIVYEKRPPKEKQSAQGSERAMAA